MRGIKTGLILLTVPLLLAGCGQQNHHKSASSSSFSSQSSSIKVTTSSYHSRTNSNSNHPNHSSQGHLEYKTPDLKKYKTINKTKMDLKKRNTDEKQFASKIAIPGVITKIGTTSSGYQNLLVTGTNNQKYLVTIKKSKVHDLSVNQKVTVYGSGLTKIKGPETGTGISNNELGKNAMDFSANIIKSR